MKTLFWISAVIVFAANCFLVTGFINVYFKNYNGGAQSSSGSIYLSLLGGLVIFVAALICYFRGNVKWALGIMGAPILLVVLYLFFMLILPVLMGERMN